MRYQFGMSVGHTYMHAASFPVSTVPAIPPDFDHCLDALLEEPHHLTSPLDATPAPLTSPPGEGIRRNMTRAGECAPGDGEVRLCNITKSRSADQGGPDSHSRTTLTLTTRRTLMLKRISMKIPKMNSKKPPTALIRRCMETRTEVY
jgi:hypothetical protein